MIPDKTTEDTARVSLGRQERIVGSVSIFLGLICIGLSLLPGSERSVSWTIGSILLLFGFCLITFSIGSLTITEETIRVHSLFSEYELAWSDLREIYVNTYRWNFILVSEKCRLYVPQSANWIGRERMQFYKLLVRKLANSGIEPSYSMKNIYFRSRYLKPK